MQLTNLLKREPVSPINIFAGGALYHKKPKQEPTIDPQKIDTLPHLGYIEFVDIQKKLYYQPRKKLSVNESATNITGTVAKPSSPSVKFTAFDAPIITNKPNGIKNRPKSKTKF